jgi:hypothetical protein
MSRINRIIRTALTTNHATIVGRRWQISPTKSKTGTTYTTCDDFLFCIIATTPLHYSFSTFFFADAVLLSLLPRRIYGNKNASPGSRHETPRIPPSDGISSPRTHTHICKLLQDVRLNKTTSSFLTRGPFQAQ